MPDQTTPAQEDHNIALPWYEAGASVVPIRADGTKRPTRDWAILQRSRLTREEVSNYWRTPAYGVALICGKISGDLEMTELEALATDEDSLYKIRRACQLRGIVGVWDHLTLQGYAEWTPSGGLHLLYRISDHDVPGNTKLASTPTGQTLAETRGEGGYVIVAPTPGTCHPTREAWTTVAGKQGVIPTITWEQRCLIHGAITSALDESPPPPPPPVTRPTSLLPTGSRPGDEFDTKVEWPEILEPAGWSYSHAKGSESFWTRPGKSTRDGHSASTGYADGKDRLFVWSSDAGLPIETPLSKFFVHAHYNFGGDMSAAAKALVKEGYGDMARRPIANELDVWEESEVSLPPRTGEYEPTETGMARRMQDEHGDGFLFCAPRKKWFEWNGTVWAEDDLFRVKQMATAVTDKLLTEAYRQLQQAETPAERKAADKALAHARASQSQAKLNAAVNLLAEQPGMSVRPKDFDADQNLLNLGNGVFNLISGELAPHDPKYMMTMTFGASYRPEAQAPKFTQFMADVIPDDETRAYVQRALGYTLLGKPAERAMFLLHGESGTGKSVLTNLMTQLFGDYGVTAPSTTFRMKRNDTTSLDLHRLRGKRFVATSEMPEGAQLDEELFKRVTGGDQVTSRNHYEEFMEWRPQCVVWIATNYLPRVNADDNAIWRRAKTVKMGTVFGGANGRQEILNYSDALMEEADGIFNWLLEGLRQYQESGLQEPAAVTTAVEDYRVDTDSVASFIRDKIEDKVLINGDGHVKSSIMLSLYETYCNEQRIPAVGGRRFANKMKTLGYAPEKVGATQMWAGLSHDPGYEYVGVPQWVSVQGRE